ncbi:hypothetical protein HY750_02605 [Candidatus Kuenenbacteria bacterium]|nr:hypothetical protein [Candidatus Kuenenbacteria bacterium]
MTTYYIFIININTLYNGINILIFSVRDGPALDWSFYFFIFVMKKTVNIKTKLMDITSQEFKTILQDSLKGFATKEDLKRFATKEDLDEKISLLRSDLSFLIREESKEINNRITKAENRIENVYNLLDGFINNILKLDEEFTFIKVQMNRLEKEMDEVKQKILRVTCPEWAKKNGF